VLGISCDDDDDDDDGGFLDLDGVEVVLCARRNK